MASVYLFGYLEDDYLGRVMVTSDELTVGALAAQLSAWSVNERGSPVAVTNEGGEQLDLKQPISAAGLGNGDIFTVHRHG